MYSNLPLFTPIRDGRLLRAMAMAGIKYTRKQLLFSLRKSETFFIFLEEGNTASGKVHIVNNHKKEFASFGFAEEDIPDVLKRAVSADPLFSVGIWNEERKQEEFSELYAYSNEMALAIGRGSNGYIVSARPLSAAKAQELMRKEAWEQASRGTRGWYASGGGCDYSYVTEYLKPATKGSL